MRIALLARTRAAAGRRLAGTPRDTPAGFDREFMEIYPCCREATMTSIERMYALWQGIRHIEGNAIAGDIVECGVWRGGSMMLAAHALLEAGSRHRDLWLYDTFEGMTLPSTRDVSVDGVRAETIYREREGAWCLASMEEVQANMASTGYPPERVRIVRGTVENTLPSQAPEQIALLRLDTDWFDSTYHELTHLFPRLADGGVLIIDDYGHWQGCREATDRYFAEAHVTMLLQRIDSTGRMGVHRRG